MLRIFHYHEGKIAKTGEVSDLHRLERSAVLWVDLQFASEEESHAVQKVFDLNFPVLKSETEMESNARFYETDELILINSNFITKRDDFFDNTPVFFYLLNDLLITERNADLTSFAETVKKMKRNQTAFQKGSEVLESILETKVDLDTDFVENMSREIAEMSRNLSQKPSGNKQELLLDINEFQEANTLSRESFIDRQRVVSALLKSQHFQEKSKLKILIKDIGTGLEHTSFIFNRLEYLQNTILGLINTEQNKSIQILTVVTVIFLPPTLIASIYGMNFHFMPELEWRYSYPVAVAFIIASSLVTLYIFKRKRWF